MNLLQPTILLTSGVVVLYILNCLYAAQVKRINLKVATYYVTVMAMLGVLGEFIIDGFYKLIIGSPLWVYRVLPIHGGYTSVFSIFIWGAMGFQIYLVHDTLSNKTMLPLYKLAILFAIEAVILEVLFDLMSLVLFGRYVYYYLPSNLWHITSLQVMPLYLLSGYFYLYVLTRFSPRVYEFSRANHSKV
jgi:hypothetical protein